LVVVVAVDASVIAASVAAVLTALVTVSAAVSAVMKHGKHGSSSRGFTAPSPHRTWTCPIKASGSSLYHLHSIAFPLTKLKDIYIYLSFRKWIFVEKKDETIPIKTFPLASSIQPFVK